MMLLGNLREREIVRNMSLGDSSLRTRGSICLAFVTDENALDSQNCFITTRIVGLVIDFYVLRRQFA